MENKSVLFTIIVSFFLFTALSLSSCGKKCYTCIGGDWDGSEICEDDGYGRLSTKAFKQDCKAGGGSVN